MSRKLCLLLAAAAMCLGAKGADYVPNYQIVDKPEYPTTEVFVQAVNILDYDPEANLGKKDVTKLVQGLLDMLGDAANYPSGDAQAKRKGGGCVYLPEGVYKIKQLNIPRGVTLRGDWKRPVKGQPITGTILASVGTYRGSEIESRSLMIMEPSTQVENVAIWYPDQDPQDPSPYPPSITFGKQGYWGNDYCTVRNVTLVNSYVGVIVSERNGGGCPNVFGLYGTPLHKGVACDNIADVGRFDHLHFSPEYWAGSGLEGAGDASEFIYNNGIGVEMRRNDWSYCCNLVCEGYNKGFWAKKSPESMTNQCTGSPNGHNYNFTMINCRSGVYVTESAGCGIMFTRVKTPGCLYGLEQAPGEGGPGQYLACEFEGTRAGVYTHTGVGNMLQFQQCTIKGGVKFDGGEMIADNCVFDGDVNIGALARCIFTSNTMRSGKLNNNSLYKCKVDNSKRTVKELPAYPEVLMDVPVTKPARIALYVADDFGAKGIYIHESLDNAQDNGPKIQAALDQAAADGGGVVYLTPGHYRCNTNLTIPTGVELRGASDICSTPRNQGAILEVMVGEGNENGTPFITMQPRSGLRGISINYPAQDVSIFSNQGGTIKVTPKKYPYAVRGNSDCYIVNLGVRACYKGVDLFTNKCDRHYVDYLSGHCFRNVIRVGGNSEGGTISNIQCNTIAYASGHEWKFGSWPNSMQMQNSGYNPACYQQNYDELEFFIVGDCKNENLYNNFLFGSNIGMLFQSDGNGGATCYSVGNAVDGVVNTFVFRATAADVDMVNSQLVALNNGHSASFFTSEASFNHTVNLFSSNNWGGGDTFVKVAGGTVNFICSNLEQSGNLRTFDVTGSGKFNLINAFVRQNKSANANSNVNVYSAVYSPKGSASNKFGEFKNVLPNSWEIESLTGFMDRDGWHAVAFNDREGKDRNGRETLSGGGDKCASRALDDNNNTRWSTVGSQTPVGWDNYTGSWTYYSPQFYAVTFDYDAKVKEKVNALVFDAATTSPDDGPAGWIVQVIDEVNGVEGILDYDKSGQPYQIDDRIGHKWRDVASGPAASGFMIVTFDVEETQGFRMIQTGHKGNYWSIDEVYAGNLEGVDALESIEINEERSLLYADRTLFVSGSLLGDQSKLTVDIYGINGQKAMSVAGEPRVSLRSLSAGAYVACVTAANGEIATLKFVIK